MQVSVVFVIAAVAVDARAAGFDCAKASTAVEKLICSDAQLSDLDGQLARAYKRVLESPGDPRRVRSEQKAWLTTERNKCADVPCLVGAYQRRLARLTATTAAPPGKATVSKDPPSFTRPPYVNPRIINDLSTWQSDEGDQVVAINLSESQDSNRYSVDIKTYKRPGKQTYVGYVTPGDSPDERPAEFGYSYVGKTTSGIDVLRTSESGGGSGVFEDLLLVKVEQDTGGGDLRKAGKTETMTFTKPRVVIRKLGVIGLGDRWDGDLKVQGDEILIGKDTGPMSTVEPSPRRTIKIDYRP